MKTITECVLTADEIAEAVKYWIRQTKGIEVDGNISFTVEGVNDPSDWRAEYALSYELTGACFAVKNG